MSRERWAYFFLLFGIWIILIWSLNPFQLLMGAFLCAVVLVLTRSLVAVTVRPFLTARAAGLLLRYSMKLIADVAVTGCDIIQRMCHPRADHASATVVLRTAFKNPLAMTILANTISLLYDTAVVDVVPARGELLIRYDVSPGGCEEKVLSRYASYQALLEKL